MVDAIGALGKRWLEGLTDYVDEAAVAETLASGTPRHAAERLVADALAAGSRDNVSVVVADVAPLDACEASWRR